LLERPHLFQVGILHLGQVVLRNLREMFLPKGAQLPWVKNMENRVKGSTGLNRQQSRLIHSHSFTLNRVHGPHLGSTRLLVLVQALKLHLAVKCIGLDHGLLEILMPDSTWRRISTRPIHTLNRTDCPNNLVA